MKFLIAALLVWANCCLAQLREGFNPDELRACIALCNSYTFLDLYGSDKDIIPAGFNKVYTSPTLAFDNKFQLYTKGQIAYLNFRGSTNQLSSWIENMYSAMIPAKGVIDVNGAKRPYTFAKEKAAAVHAGYALAIVIMAPVIIEQIQALQKQGIHQLIITGHSQGGALAHMCRTYLEHLPAKTFRHQNQCKTYAFANPMIGNQQFVDYYDRRFSEANSSYTIINPADLVPQMPMHYQEEGRLISREKIKAWLFGKESVDVRKLGMEFLIRKFEKNIKDYVTSTNLLLERMLSKTALKVDMPAYVREINYFHCGSVRKLNAFDYPKIKLDAAQLSERDKLKLKTDENGDYLKSEPTFYQHKPYNYYVGILKEYFSKDYKKLDKYYLPENL